MQVGPPADLLPIEDKKSKTEKKEKKSKNDRGKSSKEPLDSTQFFS